MECLLIGAHLSFINAILNEIPRDLCYYYCRPSGVDYFYPAMDSRAAGFFLLIMMSFVITSTQYVPHARLLAFCL